jgi:hypothetical protein
MLPVLAARAAAVVLLGIVLLFVLVATAMVGSRRTS